MLVPISFKDIFQSKMHDTQKLHLLENHIQPNPAFTFSKTYYGGCCRRFNRKWLDEQQWLRYSPAKDEGYCLPCILFNLNPQSNIFVRRPFHYKDFGKCGEAFARHRNDRTHLEAVEKAKNFMESIKNPSLRTHHSE